LQSILFFSSVKPHIKRYLNITAAEPNSGTLECHTEGKPTPTITFQKVGNGYEYQEGSNEGGRIVVRSEELVSRLTVNNLKPDDTGNYTCKAVNSAGIAAQNGTITVQCE
jgi:hypothetical protein